ncbi:MAG: hypothetical protein ACHRXM_39110 [Isosphaerales bacterium]
MTDDVLRLRLDRLQALAKSLNAVSDEISKVVQGVESYLSDQLHIGIRAEVLIEKDEDPSETICIQRKLVYGRYGPKFRLFVTQITSVDGSRDHYEETLWANCPRDVKLLSFTKLPELLDELAVQVEKVLDQVDVGYDAIQAMIPARGKAAKS